VAKIDNTKVISHLQTKWGSRPCPMCGKGPWNVQDSTYQLMEYNEGGFVVGGPIIPVIPVICGNCGNTVLVNAILSGVMEPSAPPGKEGTK
jgi:ribosomal protein S27AE